MKPTLYSRLFLATILSLGFMVSQCQGPGGADVYEPINEQEKVEYNRTLMRCLKSGGSRVVKIINQLRCY